MNQPRLVSIPCNICRGTNFTQIYEKGGLPIARCHKCALVQANPRLSQESIWQRYSPSYFWDEYMPAHNASDGIFRASTHRARNLPLVKLLKSYRQLGTLLEVGCAAGFFLQVATEEGWKVQGIEIMKPAVAYAQNNLGLDVQAGTLQDTQFTNGTFDTVVMVETVEHLLDPTADLQVAYRLLRPGGALLVAVPNLNSLMHTFLGVDWSIFSPAEHLYYFTDVTLEHLLKNVGYRKIQFIWHLGGQHYLEILNPFNNHAPQKLKSKLLRLSIQGLAPILGKIAQFTKRSDRLIALAIK